MTNHDSKALLDLANSWEVAGKQFAKEKERSAKAADEYQEKGDFRMRDVHQAEAADNEIRAEIFTICSRKLALKVGELLAARPGASGSDGNLPATGTERLSAKTDGPKDLEPFVSQRRGGVA
jgi:hypothetical protein